MARAAFLVSLVAALGSAAVGVLYTAIGLWSTPLHRSTDDVVVFWMIRLGVLIAVPLPATALLLARRVPWLSLTLAVLTLLFAGLFAAAVPAVLFGLSGA